MARSRFVPAAIRARRNARPTAAASLPAPFSPARLRERVAVMLLMIDNYDSFTYNLVQYLGELGADVHVLRNDAITLDADRGAGARRRS